MDLNSDSSFTVAESGKMVDYNIKLPEEIMMQYRKAFAVYGKEEKGKICPKDLGIVMRSLGYNPTESELQVSLAPTEHHYLLLGFLSTFVRESITLIFLTCNFQ